MKKIRTPPPQEIEKKNKGISNTPAISKRWIWLRLKSANAASPVGAVGLFAQ